MPRSIPPPLPPLAAEIERLDLREEIRELDEVGLVVVANRKLGVADAFFARMREALLRIAHERTGADFDVDLGVRQDLAGGTAPRGQFLMTHMLLDDPFYAELVVNPVKKAFMRHLLGDAHRLSTSNGWIKWRTPTGFAGPFTTAFHTDSSAPEPLPVHAPLVANMNWILTDYSRENGALAYVPGSHRDGRQVRADEALARAVPVVAPRHSLIIFHGGCWHGAFPKTTPGLRLSVHGLHCRPYYMPQHDYRGNVPAALFEQSPDRDYLWMLTRQDCPWLFDRDRAVVPHVREAG